MGRSSLIFLQAISVHISGTVNPFETLLCDGLLFQKEAIVAQPLPGPAERNQVEGSCIRSTVIGCVRNKFSLGQFSEPNFMQYLARLRVPVIIYLVGLQFAECSKRAPRKVGIHDQVLQTHDEAVASEDRHEPRNASCRNEFVLRPTSVRQT